MIFIRDQGWMHVHQGSRSERHGPSTEEGWLASEASGRAGTNWNRKEQAAPALVAACTYEPYGKRTVPVHSHPCDFNDDGQVNASDQTIRTNWDPDCSASDLDGNGESWEFSKILSERITDEHQVDVKGRSIGFGVT